MSVTEKPPTAEPAIGMRLFVGLRISMAVVRALDDVVRGLREVARARGLALRWVPASNYHVTLKFLGQCRPEVVFALRDRIGRELEGGRRIELRIQGLGAFPTADKARVVWAGIDDGGGRIAELAARVDLAARDLGFPAERRAFHPHVTLARLAQPADVRSMLEMPPEQLRSKCWVDTMVLLESTTNTDGSIYTERASWLLESASRAPKRQSRPVELAPEHGSDDDEQGGRTRARGGPEEYDHGDQGDDAESGDG